MDCCCWLCTHDNRLGLPYVLPSRWKSSASDKPSSVSLHVAFVPFHPHVVWIILKTTSVHAAVAAQPKLHGESGSCSITYIKKIELHTYSLRGGSLLAIRWDTGGRGPKRAFRYFTYHSPRGSWYSLKFPIKHLVQITLTPKSQVHSKQGSATKVYYNVLTRVCSPVSYFYNWYSWVGFHMQQLLIRL